MYTDSIASWIHLPSPSRDLSQHQSEQTCDCCLLLFCTSNKRTNFVWFPRTFWGPSNPRDLEWHSADTLPGLFG